MFMSLNFVYSFSQLFKTIIIALGKVPTNDNYGFMMNFTLSHKLELLQNNLIFSEPYESSCAPPQVSHRAVSALRLIN